MLDVALAPGRSSSRARLSDADRAILVDGQSREACNGKTFPVRDPATGTVLADVSNATPIDAHDALRSAAGAQLAFGKTSARYRRDILPAAYEGVVKRENDFAALITSESGKSLAKSLGEVRYDADYLRLFAEEAPRIAGESRMLPDGTSQIITIPRPVGVCVRVTPWNFPIAMIARKVAPAIADGCASVIKPAEDTPLTTLAFADLFSPLGLPGGDINVVPTMQPREVVAQLLTDGTTGKLSFIRSTAVGRQLLALASNHFMRCSMELNGNAPFFVFADAELDVTLDAAMVAKFRNGGHACTAANRFFIHADVADEFTTELASRVSALKIGGGLDASTTLGPVIHELAAERAVSLIDEAALRDGELVVGGGRPARDGSFVEPRIVAGIPDGIPMRTTEIFAPIVGISTFTVETDVIRRANSTDDGLVAYAFIEDATRQYRVAQDLQFGMVAVNRGLVANSDAPFGCIKHAGLGQEGLHGGTRRTPRLRLPRPQRQGSRGCRTSLPPPTYAACQGL